MSKLCTTEPDAPAPEPVDGPGGGSDIEIAVSGAVRFAARPLKLVNVVPNTLTTVIDTVKRARTGMTMAPPFVGAQDRVQRQRDRPPQRRVRAAGSRGHQDRQEPLRRQGQRRGDGPGVRGAADLPAQPRRTAGQLPGGDGAGVGAREVRPARPQPGVGHVRPAGDQHRRSRGAAQGHRRSQCCCQTTQFGHRGDAAAGLDPVRRARGVRHGDAGVREQPAHRRPAGAQPGGVQRARARRCRCTSSAARSRRCIRSGRSSTARD